MAVMAYLINLKLESLARKFGEILGDMRNMEDDISDLISENKKLKAEVAALEERELLNGKNNKKKN
jgi:regulator of replication initiation timing